MNSAVLNTLMSVARRHNGQKVYPAKKKHWCSWCSTDKAAGYWPDGEFVCRSCARAQEKEEESSDSDREPTAAERRRSLEEDLKNHDSKDRYEKAMNAYNERNADAIQRLACLREEQRLKRLAFIASGGDKDDAYRRFPSPEWSDFVKERMPQAN